MVKLVMGHYIMCSLLRMVNGGVSKTIELILVDENGKEPTHNCDVWEIAYDGIYLHYARKQKLGKSLLDLGARVDWIVVCNRPGIYEVLCIFVL